MSKPRKIIAWISIFAIAISMLCVPSFATSGSAYDQKSNFYHWIKDVPFIGDWIGYTTGMVCTNSGDGYHHASSYKTDMEDGYYRCICSYCGHEFTAYESDLQQSYNNYVSTLPTTGYNSSGNLIWSPGFGDVGYYKYSTGGSYTRVGSLPYEGFGLFFNGTNVIHSYQYYYGKLIFVCCDIVAPISGSYKLLPTDYMHFTASLKSGGSKVDLFQYTAGSFKHYNQGAKFDGPDDTVSSSADRSSISSVYVIISFPVYEIIPDASLGNTYNTNSRPTNITGGNYGVVGDNGQMNVVTNNNSIVNETNNTFFNPATGLTGNITNWSYDYSDRSYNLTLDSGDTVNVRYGDENITIVQGGITYNIYYIIEGSGSDPEPSTSPEPTPSPDPTPGASADPEPSTSLTPGPGPSSDPGSGDSDDDGESIWEKIGKFLGTILGGLIDLIIAVLGKILDALIALGEMLMDKLAAVVEVVLSLFDVLPKLFGGFLDFLSLVFPYIPSEITLLLTFGIVAVVFIAIIKAVRR